MDLEKMDRMATRFLKGFTLAAVAGAVSFAVMVWGCAKIYDLAERYHEFSHYEE